MVTDIGTFWVWHAERRRELLIRAAVIWSDSFAVTIDRRDLGALLPPGIRSCVAVRLLGLPDQLVQPSTIIPVSP